MLNDDEFAIDFVNRFWSDELIDCVSETKEEDVLDDEEDTQATKFFDFIYRKFRDVAVDAIERCKVDLDEFK